MGPPLLPRHGLLNAVGLDHLYGMCLDDQRQTRGKGFQNCTLARAWLIRVGEADEASMKLRRSLDEVYATKPILFESLERASTKPRRSLDEASMSSAYKSIWFLKDSRFVEALATRGFIILKGESGGSLEASERKPMPHAPHRILVRAPFPSHPVCVCSSKIRDALGGQIAQEIL